MGCSGGFFLNTSAHTVKAGRLHMGFHKDHFLDRYWNQSSDTTYLSDLVPIASGLGRGHRTWPARPGRRLEVREAGTHSCLCQRSGWTITDTHSSVNRRRLFSGLQTTGKKGLKDNGNHVQMFLHSIMFHWLPNKTSRLLPHLHCADSMKPWSPPGWYDCPKSTGRSKNKLRKCDSHHSQFWMVFFLILIHTKAFSQKWERPWGKSFLGFCFDFGVTGPKCFHSRFWTTQSW